jgi:OOP family OmpA-OmpF porin
MRFGKGGLACFAVAASLALPAAAQAQSNTLGFYGGLNLGQSQAREFDCTGLPSCEDRGSAWKVFGGYQFHPNVAAEVAYFSLGQFRAGDPAIGEEIIRSSLGEASIVALFHGSDRVSIFGRVGAYYASTKGTFTATSGAQVSAKENNSGLAFGAGLQFFITRNLALRGEVERFAKVGSGDIGDSDIDVYSLGALLKFQ